MSIREFSRWSLNVSLHMMIETVEIFMYQLKWFGIGLQKRKADSRTFENFTTQNSQLDEMPRALLLLFILASIQCFVNAGSLGVILFGF